jgi:hypothetical protein
MTEPYGVPHKNGMVRFYLVGTDEDVYRLPWVVRHDGLGQRLGQGVGSRTE